MGFGPEYQNKGVVALIFNDLIPVLPKAWSSLCRKLILNWKRTALYRRNGIILSGSITKKRRAFYKELTK